MAPSRSPSPQHNGRKRGRIACRACRQAKVRCNLEQIPCTRCIKLKLDCSVDPGFKRTNKQDKVHELESHVQQLQSLVSQQGQQRFIASPQQPAVNPWATSSPRAASQDGLIASIPTIPSDHRGLNTPNSNSEPLSSLGAIQHERCLGDVRLSKAEVDSLFQIYFERYHHSLPILDPKKSPDDYFNSSSILSWTVISIAARQYRQDSDLLKRLMPLLSDHIWREFGSSTRSVVGASAWNISEIQSMALLAIWPLPNVRLWSDKSMVLGHMALTSAMHIGLHRPGYEYDYCREKIEITEQMLQERTGVWLACYCTSISLCIEYGHPPLIPTVDWTVNNICGPKPTIFIPDELRHHTLIQRFANNAFQQLFALCEDPVAIARQPSFFTVMNLLDTNMDQLEQDWISQMSLVNKIRLFGTRLLLQCMFFLDDEPSTERKVGVLKAYKTATEMIRMLVEDNGANDLLACAPHSFLRILLRAGFVIVRVLQSAYGDVLDRENGKFLYNTTAFLLRQMSVQPKERDQPIRVAEALRDLWLSLENNMEMKSRIPQLALKSRAGASLTYDSLVLYRDKVKKMHRAPQIHPMSVGDALVTYEDVAMGARVLQTLSEPLTNDPILDFSDLSWMDSLGFPGFFTDD